MGKESGFLRWNLLVKIVEMRTKDIEYDIKGVDKTATGFERTDSSVERNSTAYQTVSQATEELFMKGRVNQRDKLHW